MDQTTPDKNAETAGQQVAQDTADEADTTMPGGRAALPKGTLRDTHQGPQADEHRDQPIDAKNEIRRPDVPPLVD